MEVGTVERMEQLIDERPMWAVAGLDAAPFNDHARSVLGAMTVGPAGRAA